MKKIHIAIAALILTLGSILIEACQSNQCECCEPVLYSIKDITMVTIQEGTTPKSLRFVFNASQQQPTEANINQEPCVTFMARNYSKEKFTSLKIIDNKGEDLTSLFQLNNFKIGDQLHMQAFHFRPTFSVSEKTVQQFTFTITLDDGRTFEFKSDMLELFPD